MLNWSRDRCRIQNVKGAVRAFLHWCIMDRGRSSEPCDLSVSKPPHFHSHRWRARPVFAPGRVRICPRSSVGIFRGHHHALTVVFHKLAEKRFARSVCVKGGGVDEIPARLAEGIAHLPCLVLGRTPTPFIAEGHGAKPSAAS